MTTISPEFSVVARCSYKPRMAKILIQPIPANHSACGVQKYGREFLGLTSHGRSLLNVEAPSRGLIHFWALETR
jgi:hypothetical protein